MTDPLLTLLAACALLALIVATALLLPPVLDRHSEPLVTVISASSDADGVGDVDLIRYATLGKWECR